MTHIVDWVQVCSTCSSLPLVLQISEACFYHGEQEECNRAKSSLKEHFKAPFMSYLLTSHQPNQVKRAKLKSRGRANTQHPQPPPTPHPRANPWGKGVARVWIHNTREERRTEISYSHSCCGVSCHPPASHHLPFLSSLSFTSLQGSRKSLLFISAGWFPFHSDQKHCFPL